MKNVILMRGVSGSGKSSLTNTLCNKIGNVSVSADDYFVDDLGNYNFDATKIHLAHADCQRKFLDFLKEPSTELIIVDNTNLDILAINTYQSLAEKHGAIFTSIIVENRHGNESIHNVPSYVLDRQESKILKCIKLR
jgi:predicted kinase